MSLPVMVWVMKHSEATLGARLVLLALAEHANDDGTEAWPSVETLVERTRMSRKGVQGALRRLEADGMIEHTGAKPWGTNIYTVVMEGGVVSSPPPRTSFSEGANLVPAGGVAASPNPSFTRQENPSETLSERVLAAWTGRPNLIQHRPAYLRSKVGKELVTTLIERRVEQYDLESVLAAIENYADVLISPLHYWNHKWTLGDFLVRGLDRFVPEAEPLEVFRTQAKRDMTPDRARATVHAIGEAIERRNASQAGEKLALSDGSVYDYPDEHGNLTSEG